MLRNNSKGDCCTMRRLIEQNNNKRQQQKVIDMRYFRSGYYCRLQFISWNYRAFTSIPRDLYWVRRSRYLSNGSDDVDDSYSYAGGGDLAFYENQSAKVVR